MGSTPRAALTSIFNPYIRGLCFERPSVTTRWPAFVCFRMPDPACLPVVVSCFPHVERYVHIW